VERVAAETDHKVKFIEAYGGKIAKVHETLEAVEKGLLDLGAYCVCFETAKLLPLNFDYFVPFTSADPRIVNKVKASLIEKYPELTAVLPEKYNQIYLPGLSAFDDYGIGTVEPWKKAEELKGRKIVAAGPNLPWVSLFGAIPVTSTLPTMYNDMATGVAEGTVNIANSLVNHTGKYISGKRSIGKMPSNVVSGTVGVVKGVGKGAHSVVTGLGSNIGNSVTGRRRKRGKTRKNRFNHGGSISELSKPTDMRANQWVSIIPI
jgi:hypothetical protein